MEQANEEIISRKWHNRWWGIILLLVFVIIILVPAIFIYNLVYFIETSQAENTNVPANNLATIETSDDPSQGASQPLITIVEFGDFQCTYTREEYPIIKRLVNQYPDEVKLIYRDFPISASHPDAVAASVAADCANEQGKFWEYHDLLFDNQGDLSATNLLALAQSLGLDSAKFTQCLNSQKYLNEVKNDLMDGLKLQISGTPTFFINGFKVQGVISYLSWVDLIEKYKSLNNHQ